MTDIRNISRDVVRPQKLSGRVAKAGAGAILAAAALVLPSTGAKAVLIDSNLMITGAVDFNESFSNVSGTASQMGTMKLASGGATSTSTIMDTTVTAGANPLTGPLTQIGDGVGALGSMSGFSFEQASSSLLAIDLFVEVQNTSATDTFKITFKATSDNAAFANSELPDTNDVRVQSTFTVSDSTTEVFGTNLLSDPKNGDSMNGVGQGTFGELLVDMAMATFDITSTPQTTDTITGTFLMNGEAIDPFTFYDAGLDAFLSIDSVMNVTPPPPPPPPATSVPEPATIALFGFGLAGLGVMTRRRKLFAQDSDDG